MAAAFTNQRIAGIGVGAFAGVLLFGLVAGVGAFFWTIGTTDEAEFRPVSSQSTPRLRDPDPLFPTRVRDLLAEGRFTAVIDACRTRRVAWPNDAEAYLYAAFALDELGKEPGFFGFEAAVTADRVWEGLLRKASNPDRGFYGSRTYMTGWAQLGLGRPMLANDAFGRYLQRMNNATGRLDSYNRACYLALAGQPEAAQRAYARAARRQRLQQGWAAADPDLETIRDTFEFRVWNTYADLVRGLDWQSVRGTGRQNRGAGDPVILGTDL